ncbi:MAG TPA: type III polyketide synthase [Sphingobium sp.]|nr:type III polyketide synthase [Sphingobium sp.]
MTTRSPPQQPRLLGIGTAVPANPMHDLFVEWALTTITDERERALFLRMVERCGIEQRWMVLDNPPGGHSPVDPGGFYGGAALPGTGARMTRYAEEAPRLAMTAIGDLASQCPIDGITHLVVASCTGFTAPGLDQRIAALLGLSPRVERLFVGYMGCYAAVTALRSAWHIVRSRPEARVLVVCVELCSLHLNDGAPLDSLLAMLQFGDGAAAALVAASGGGLALTDSFSATLPDTHDLIRWDIGDSGFVMHLSGQVPGQIRRTLAEERLLLPLPAGDVAHWAVHAGGRSILDAVESGLALPPDALDDSRAVLRDYGNMSSATLMFVLARKLKAGAPGPGVAMAFGPGLAVEGLLFGTD